MIVVSIYYAFLLFGISVLILPLFCDWVTEAPPLPQTPAPPPEIMQKADEEENSNLATLVAPAEVVQESELKEWADTAEPVPKQASAELDGWFLVLGFFRVSRVHNIALIKCVVMLAVYKEYKYNGLT